MTICDTVRNGIVTKLERNTVSRGGDIAYVGQRLSTGVGRSDRHKVGGVHGSVHKVGGVHIGRCQRRAQSNLARTVVDAESTIDVVGRISSRRIDAVRNFGVDSAVSVDCRHLSFARKNEANLTD